MESIKNFLGRKKREDRFPRFSSLAKKKTEVMFGRELNTLYINFTNYLREKYGNEEVGGVMVHHAGMSTPPKNIAKWNFEGKDSLEKFLFKIVLKKKSTEFLQSKFKEKYLKEFFDFSNGLL